MLSSRILTAVIFFTIFLLALFHPAFVWALPLILLATSLWGTHEFMHFGAAKPSWPFLVPAMAGSVMLIADAYWFQMAHALPIIALIAVLALTIGTVTGQPHATEMATLTITGPVYIALPLAFSTLIWHNADNANAQYYLIFLVAVTWSGDIGAYFAGRLWGRHKLAPRISPAKTVEGLIGGILLTLIVAGGLKIYWNHINQIFNWLEVIFLALAFSVIGPVGDLAESRLKRSSGLKDSGRTFTGYGGMLDIIDSILFTAVFYYGYLLIFHPMIFHFLN